MRSGLLLVTAGLVLTAGGGALLWLGASDGSGGLSVTGILVLVGGLVCLRVAYWRVRVRAMTRAGLALHPQDDHDAEP